MNPQKKNGRYNSFVLFLFVCVHVFTIFSMSFSFSWRRIVGGVCDFLAPVSSQQKFETFQLLDRPVLQLSFIQKVKEKTSSRSEGMPTQKTQREERPPAQFWLLFLCFFLLPLGLPYVNWASQQCCLYYLQPSLWSLDLSLFSFLGLSLP